MNALPVSLNVRENPQKNHWKETTAMVIMLRYIIDRAFFRLADVSGADRGLQGNAPQETRIEKSNAWNHDPY